MSDFGAMLVKLSRTPCDLKEDDQAILDSMFTERKFIKKSSIKKDKAEESIKKSSIKKDKAEESSKKSSIKKIKIKINKPDFDEVNGGAPPTTSN